ncbi:MAG: hypothetical protein MZW92_37225 [Comamonadaceae bacterium]|nr:hypothetical protein [Comamonadaceae bacterium]
MTILWLLPLLPLAVACTAALGAKGAWMRFATLAASLGSLVLSIYTAAIVARAGKLELISGWFGLNALAAVFLLLTAALAVTAALFSLGYVRELTEHDTAAEHRYYLNFNLFVASLLLVPLMLEVALAWVAVELTTLLSIFLVGFDNTSEALEAAWKYAVLTIMGATVAALGFFLLLWGLAQADPTGTTGQTFDAVVAALSGHGAGAAQARLRADPGRLRHQDRSGAGAYVAAGRTFAGTHAGVRAALRHRSESDPLRRHAAAARVHAHSRLPGC